jgi:3-methylcrotonyl-CoA carboxylase alpha subunit
MFDKILIANRGEIACRVIETAHKMGIRCVAVYSNADRYSKHVAMADEAYHIGPAPAKDSYLKADLIIEVAKRSGAQAIHPGYGFLSENAGFTKACAENGIKFIGPGPEAIEAMGSKSGAKEIMEAANVPLVQGYHGENQEPEFLRGQAQIIGYPVLIKATAGGGGKGMRVVLTDEEFIEGLASCKREAASSFGDDKVLVEKYLTKPRHVEIQVFADSHGNAVHVFERDCSVQRRHQKVIEEAPAPGLSEETRQAMGAVAIKAAQAINYEGAGTVEFLYDEDGSFYFMEMNTRLQVEHPVTEKISGLDLVEWQLLVAFGAPLPLNQDQLKLNGHAFEVRIYAEDPNQDFLPATGSITHLSTPTTSEHVRIDSGVRAGDEISIYYDPMISKLIVWDKDRASALARLRGALADYELVGLTTNIRFLTELASHPKFNQADIDTGFIGKYTDDLIKPVETADNESLALASLHILLERDQEATKLAANSQDPYSPWNMTSGWRLNQDNFHTISFQSDEQVIEVTAHYRDNGLLLELPSEEMLVSAHIDANGEMQADLAGKRVSASVVREDQLLTILTHGRQTQLTEIIVSGAPDDEVGGGNLTAPMPGAIIQVMVEAGQTVKAGQAILIMEAMKMEHTISAPADGVITEVLYAQGDQVADGAELVLFEAAE